MKTPEEFIKQSDYMFDTIEDQKAAIKLLEDFANAKAKALLEEAAEKFNSLKIENKSQIFIDGYNEAAFDMMQIIKSLSLIPKDTTKD